jgi:hypothetical protein
MSAKWLDGNKQRLNDLWLDGKSVRYISDMLGVSRNAIIGVIGRLRGKEGAIKWPMKQKGRQRSFSSRVPARIKCCAAMATSPKVPQMPVTPLPAIIIAADDSEPNPIWRSLIDLPARACRYPLPDGTWCGCKITFIAHNGVSVPSPYCKEHYILCH